MFLLVFGSSMLGCLLVPSQDLPAPSVAGSGGHEDSPVMAAWQALFGHVSLSESETFHFVKSHVEENVFCRRCL